MSSNGGKWDRRRLVWVGAIWIALAAGCASVGDSPRAPYAPPPAPASAAAGSSERAGAGAQAFRVLDAWDWTTTLSASDGERFGEGALARGRIGLFDAARFDLALGRCSECGASALTRWWLGDEIVALPKAGAPGGGGTGSGGRISGNGARPPAAAAAMPDDVLIGAPRRVLDARLAADGRVLRAAGREIALALAPRIDTNAAYADRATARYFADRPLVVRGAVARSDDAETRFVARTIFPADLRIDTDRPARPLARNELLATLVEAQAGVEAVSQRVLFKRVGAVARPGRAIVALVLTGAQGDDDGARAGHLAIATGVLGERGEWHDWLVTNFYPLLDGNAKGIVPASLPIDNYLYDLNSGQLYYRPGYMLVAVLRRAHAAEAVQRALDDTLRRLYCGDIEFNRARRNSTAMTIDPLRALGWRIPTIGPTSRIAGLLAAPIAAIVRLSFATARDIYSTFAAEKTRLLPRVAFEVAGHDLLHLAALGGVAERLDGLTPFERALAEDVEAVVFVRLPQVPSSRRLGTYPAASLVTYGASLLADPGGYQGAPEAGPRAFSERLREACPSPGA